MSRLESLKGGMVAFYCPGCKCSHMVDPKKWQVDIEKETISPSVLVKSVKLPPEPWVFDENRKIIGCKDTICHSFVKSGKIQFLNDCSHELSGKTVEMENM